MRMLIYTEFVIEEKIYSTLKFPFFLIMGDLGMHVEVQEKGKVSCCKGPSLLVLST